MRERKRRGNEFFNRFSWGLFLLICVNLWLILFFPAQSPIAFFTDFNHQSPWLVVASDPAGERSESVYEPVSEQNFGS